MNAFILLAGISIVLIVLVIMFLKLGGKTEEEGGSNHFALQLIVLGFILFFLLIVGKTAVDNNETCNWNIVNSTVTGATTVYNYSYDCVANTKNTTNIFYRTLVWFVRIVALYIALYFVYEVLAWFGMIKKQKRGEE